MTREVETSAVPVRLELLPLPLRIARLPVGSRGYPVPWFVEWIGEDGHPVQIGEGEPDFRVMSAERWQIAVREGRCWTCGEGLDPQGEKAFVIGPMCAVTRTSSEPPSHLGCADFAARACPFLVRPHAKRREAGMPDEVVEAPGLPLKRNPGVTLVWVTQSYRLFSDDSGGSLVEVGEPEGTAWYCEGRVATRAEVMASIESGLPALRDVAEAHGETEALDEAIATAMRLIPTV